MKNALISELCFHLSPLITLLLTGRLKNILLNNDREAIAKNITYWYPFIPSGNVFSRFVTENSQKLSVKILLKKITARNKKMSIRVFLIHTVSAYWWNVYSTPNVMLPLTMWRLVYLNTMLASQYSLPKIKVWAFLPI